jgi:alkanesulfonate monooxygenase SsuD/methylene tetrahydromethanopterin reductase-like flavin-dependent oxidoreductase (luciferase family)
LECLSLLARVAKNTKKIKILPLVTNNLIRHPGVLAKIAASVDQASDGRLIFGIGSGSQLKDLAHAGYDLHDADARARMLHESISVILKLWTEESSTFAGNYYTLRDAESLPKPRQKPHPPVLVGGKTRVLPICAAFADYTNFRSTTFEECSSLLEILKENCKLAKRSYDSIKKTIAAKVIFSDSAEGSSEYRAIFGNADDMVQKIARFESMGIDGIFVGFPRNAQKESAEQFAKSVLPLILQDRN